MGGCLSYAFLKSNLRNPRETRPNSSTISTRSRANAASAASGRSASPSASRLNGIVGNNPNQSSSGEVGGGGGDLINELMMDMMRHQNMSYRVGDRVILIAGHEFSGRLGVVVGRAYEGDPEAPYLINLEDPPENTVVGQSNGPIPAATPADNQVLAGPMNMMMYSPDMTNILGGTNEPNSGNLYVTPGGNAELAVGDRVKITGSHDRAGSRGWVLEKTSTADVLFFAITLDDGTLTHCGLESLEKVVGDGAARPMLFVNLNTSSASSNGSNEQDPTNTRMPEGSAQTDVRQHHHHHHHESNSEEHTDSVILDVLSQMHVAQEWFDARHTYSELTNNTSSSSAASNSGGDMTRSLDSSFEPTECVICSEPLFQSICSVLTKNVLDPDTQKIIGRKRVCNHFFHMDCLRQVFLAKKLERKCPFCRTPFEEYLTVPDIRRSPKAWFEMVSMNHEGKMFQTEVIAAVQSLLPVNGDKLVLFMTNDGADTSDEDTPARALWSTWATPAHELNVSANPASDAGVIARTHRELKELSYIDIRSFVNPNGGLLVWLLSMIRELHRNKQDSETMPSLLDKDQRFAWFDYWDFTGCGILTLNQVVRALIITLAKINITIPVVGKSISNSPLSTSLKELKPSITALKNGPNPNIGRSSNSNITDPAECDASNHEGTSTADEEENPAVVEFKQQHARVKMAVKGIWQEFAFVKHTEARESKSAEVDLETNGFLSRKRISRFIDAFGEAINIQLNS